ncbi:MAG: methyl-accepting chemotaxis protein, partial [Candidatus Heimdallarchaeota archaeon]|nr:methyl-accepting chemotaxis protein [Candidatus Heimdallarchaeota archaeon]
KDDINTIITTHETQDKLIKSWASGIEVFIDVLYDQKEFHAFDDLLDGLYSKLKSGLLILKQTEGSEILNVLTAQAITNDITGNYRPDYYGKINGIFGVFKLVPQKITDSIVTSTDRILIGYNQLMANISHYMVNRDPDLRTEITNQIGFLPSYGQQLGGAIDPISVINNNTYNIFDGYKNQFFGASGGISPEVTIVMNRLPADETLEDLSGTELEEIRASYVIINEELQNMANLQFLIHELADELNDEMRTSIIDASDTVVILKTELTKLKDWADLGQKLVLERFSRTTFNQIVTLVIIAIIGFASLVAVNLIISRDIISPIGVIALWSDYIAEGDLTKTRHTRMRDDEVGVLEQNFKHMNSNLRFLIKDIHDTNELIAFTSEELSSNTEEINATAEEVSAIAQSMATGSTQQAEIITTIVEELQDVNDVVDSVISQITHNLSIVKDLSEQTNVLALNTAIEAANAGEFGRGFTVIAENIRTMSDQSSRTAKLITKDSKAILSQLQTTFGIITEKIENVAAVSEETAASAQEVAASAEEMTATMESIAAKSTMLNDQSMASMTSVNRFILTEDDLISREGEIKLKKHKEIVIDEDVLTENKKDDEQQSDDDQAENEQSDKDD